jgi:hypothetical protein
MVGLFLLACIFYSSAVFAVPDDGFRPLPPALQQQGSANQPSLDQDLQYADALSTDLYCGAVTVLSSNLGVFFGLAVAAFGFLNLLAGSVGRGIFLIAGGVFFTAIPGWFESGMDSTAQTLSPVTGRGAIMKQKFAGNQGACNTAGRR